MARSSVVGVVLCVLAAACSGAAESDADAAAASERPPPATSAAPASRGPATTAPASTALWRDVTADAIGETVEWTNRVELADIDADGDVDLLFADGAAREGPGDPVVNQVFVNDGAAVFEDVSEQVWGPDGDLSWAVRAHDLNGDGLVDLFAGTTWQTQSRLLLGRGGLEFEEVTDTHLPQVDASVGDVAVGDVDGDGDLDLALADWGPGDPYDSEGAPAMLWLNDGAGVFTDVSADRLPRKKIRYSWDLEMVDVDNDLDLDLAISCRTCTGNFLYHNDGSGTFTDASEQLPQHNNNYEFEAMDVTGDGYLDLATVDDADGVRNHLFVADGQGGFTDGTPAAMADEDTFIADSDLVWLDHDSDGDADLLVGSLDAERLFVNDGDGEFTVVDDVLGNTAGTLGLAAADLNGDAKLDVVEAQGEMAAAEKMYLGDAIPPDTAPPVIGNVVAVDGVVHARVHDNLSPSGAHAWQEVVVEGDGGPVPMVWYGEHLWRSDAVVGAGDHRVCATDAAGNQACSDPVTMTTASDG
jgi:hypothetical protein